MGALTMLILLAVAYVFWQGGMTFFAFLAVIVAALLALAPPKKEQQAAPYGYPSYPGYPAPIVMGGGGGNKIPELMKIKIKPYWGDTANSEDWAEAMGKGVNMVGRTIAWILRGFKGPPK